MFAALVLAAAVVAGPVWAGGPAAKATAVDRPQDGHFDLRIHNRPQWARLVAAADPAAATRQRAAGVTREMGAAAARWRARDAGVDVQPSLLVGGVEVLRSRHGALSDPAPGQSGEDVARGFLARHGDLFGLSPAQVASLRSRGESGSPSGLRMVRLEQTVDGRPVFQAELRVVLDREGRVVRVVGRPVPGLEAPVPAGPWISAAQALVAALAPVGLDLDPAALRVTAVEGRWLVASNRPELPEAVPSRQVLFPLAPGLAVPAWAQVVLTRGAGAWYTVVAASDGTVLFRKELSRHASTQEARFAVYVRADGVTPAASPAPGAPNMLMPGDGTQFPTMSRSEVLMSVAQNLVATPDGWLPDGGMSTAGNNVEAYLDVAGDDDPDVGLLDYVGRPRGNPDSFGRDRNFLGTAPRSYRFTPPPTGGDPTAGDPPTPAPFRRGAVTQVFYTTNWFHDRLFQLGFDEAAGNFQLVNYTASGVANDRVRAEVQDGGGINNAFFVSTPDGDPPRMELFLFTDPTPDRDSALDNFVVIHELTHGVVDRLLGDTGGVIWFQGAAMAEGWSDFYALALLFSQGGDNPGGQYPAGSYATYGLQGLTDNYLYGIRRFPYSTNLAVNPLTLEDVDQLTVDLSGGITPSPLNQSAEGAYDIYNAGELWASALWQMRRRIIEAHGGNVVLGNEIALQLVTDGLKMTPADPSFIDARNALLDADCAASACAHEDAIWSGFAERGLGFGASSSAGVSLYYGTRESFAMPGLQAVGATVTEVAGNGNGVPEPTETLAVSVELHNPWQGTGKGVPSAMATVEVLSPGIAVGGPLVSTFPAIPAGGSAVGTPFNIDTTTLAHCGGVVTLRLTVTSTLGTTMTEWDLRLGLPGGPTKPEVYERILPPGGLAIPDGMVTGVVDSFFIEEDLDIMDVDFRVDELRHTWVGDISIALRNPQGHGADLIYRTAEDLLGSNSGDDFIGTRIDDASLNDLLTAGPAAAPFTGDWLPVLNSPSAGLGSTPGQLGFFNGFSARGTWQLYLIDHLAEDIGTLHAWSLILTPRAYFCETMGTPLFADGFESGDTSAWTDVSSP